MHLYEILTYTGLRANKITPCTFLDSAKSVIAFASAAFPSGFKILPQSVYLFSRYIRKYTGMFNAVKLPRILSKIIKYY